ncbi:MAG: type I-A CRISPR-associated protein Cas7/Csa2 [Candidatus Caldarchaeum sp.]
MHISLGLRFLCNVEALNMVESIGNVSKHRKAPIVIPSSSGFRLLYVPAISGESIGHGYQQALVEEALNLYGDKAPLDEWSRRGEFIKFADMKHMTETLKELISQAKESKKQKDTSDIKHEIEKEVVRSSLIADVGGFLIAEGVPVKRTSCFQVGYAVPVFDGLEATAIESQFHVRHMISESKESQAGKGQSQGSEPSAAERAGQMIYYVELASAVYGLTFNLNLDKIGRTSTIKIEDAVDDRLSRVKISLIAISRLFTGGGFGAKRSRYLPVEDILTVVAAVSKFRPFVVSPPHYATFVDDTVKRKDAMLKMLENFNAAEDVAIFGFSKEKPLPNGVVSTQSFEELMDRVAEHVLSQKP